MKSFSKLSTIQVLRFGLKESDGRFKRDSPYWKLFKNVNLEPSFVLK